MDDGEQSPQPEIPPRVLHHSKRDFYFKEEMMNYAQQIKHPNWQKKRLEVLGENGFQCENCGSKDDELHAHHPLYKRGAMIWQYDVSELECLCGKCHKDAHAIDDQLKKKIALLSPYHKNKLLGYCDSMLGPEIHSNEKEYIAGFEDNCDGINRRQK